MNYSFSFHLLFSILLYRFLATDWQRMWITDQADWQRIGTDEADWQRIGTDEADWQRIKADEADWQRIGNGLERMKRIGNGLERKIVSQVGNTLISCQQITYPLRVFRILCKSLRVTN
jgi:hypothetical protein